MNISKSIIDQRIIRIIADNTQWFSDDSVKTNVDKQVSRAFLMLGIASYVDINLDESYSCLTDDGNDAGIDAIYIGEVTETEFQIVVFQSKYYRGKKMENDSSFEENAIVKVLYGLDVIFDTRVQITLNDKLKRKVAEIQSLSYTDALIPQVTCVMLSNGGKWTNMAQQKIDNYKTINKNVEFDFFNHDDILNYIQSNKEIKATLKLSGKAFTETLPNFKRALIGKIEVSKVAELLNEHGDNLLERNIRKYLGLNKNRINTKIKETLLGDKKENFYLYNNGITFICSKFRENGFATDWVVKVDDLQIINGGQTCKTIQQTLQENPDADFTNVFVMLRLYEIDKEDEQVITDITLSTNSQNPVDLRDLKANDAIQRYLEISIKDLGFSYKRKRDNIFHYTPDNIASSAAAEAILTIWQKSPHIAKYKRTDLFGKYYDRIFEHTNASQLVMAVLIFRFCDNQRRRENLIQMHNHLPYSNYLMAMLMGWLLLKENGLTLTTLTHKTFDSVRAYFEANKETIFEKANRIIVELLRQEYNNYPNVELRKLAATFRKNETTNEVLKKIAQ
jgi:hypothetical protein